MEKATLQYHWAQNRGLAKSHLEMSKFDSEGPECLKVISAVRNIIQQIEDPSVSSAPGFKEKPWTNAPTPHVGSSAETAEKADGLKLLSLG